ncbi:MAG: peptide chain release factor N(5)-glutamine methyltransferase [Ignavibacteriae bacterium]|nr:peptide chain release factor N(5)-glutamine methyltransferase [Ignavibacteriota bacterium]
MGAETIQSLLRKSVAFLEEQGVDEARRSAEMLLCSVLGVRRIDLYLRFEQPVKEDELVLYRTLIRRRLAREPVQYIMGDTEFYSLPFRVTPDVLIPRPETEHLAEAAIAALRAADGEARALDIGTGSGILAVVLAREAPKASLTASDISAAALAVAADNAARNGVAERIRFLAHDILTGSPEALGGPFEVVVSNPPYIAPQDMAELQREISEYEPRAALTDERDGLTFYRRFAGLAAALLAPGGRMFLEIGMGQRPDIERIFVSAGCTRFDVIADYSGIERVLVFGFGRW